MTTPWPTLNHEGPIRPDLGPLEIAADDSIGVIYFLGSEDGTRIKFGYTKQLKKRDQTHQGGDAFGRGGEFEILAYVRGGRADETRLKQYFKAARIRDIAKTEVYHPEPLIPYVTWLRDQYFVSTSLREFASESGQIAIESSAWLPSPERVSMRRSTGLFVNETPWSFLPNRQITADDWYAPPELVEPIRAALGGVIDLDPATHVYANEKIKARRIYTKNQNGLLQPWRGRVYLNPPFDDWEIWAHRADAEWDRGEITDLIMLGFTRTMTAQYFAPTLARTDALAIIRGRYTFWGRETISESAPDGVFLMYRGAALARFRHALEPISSWIGFR